MEKTIRWTWVAAACLVVVVVGAGCDHEFGDVDPLVSTYMDDPHAGVWLEWYTGAVAGGIAPDLVWSDLLDATPTPGDSHFVELVTYFRGTCEIVLWIVQVDTYEGPLEKSGNVGGAVVEIPRGYPVKVLYNGITEPWYNLVSWDGRDESGRLMPAGVYRAYAVINGQMAASIDLYLLRNASDYWFAKTFIEYRSWGYVS